MGDAITVLKTTAVNWYNTMLTLFMLNLAMLLFSLTVVLLPPALAAMYAITDELAYGQSLGFMEYLQAIKQYFVKSWLWTLLNILVFAILGSNIVFYGRMAAGWSTILQTVFLILSLYWIIVQVYFWPFMMRQEVPSIRTAMRNTALTSLASPGFTLVIVIVSLLIMGVSMVFLFPLVLGTPAIVILLGSTAVRNRLETFAAENQDTPAAEE